MPTVRVTVRETPIFGRRADALLSADEREELIAYLAENPLAGKVIKETGGVRKVRFAATGKGKSGGGAGDLLFPRSRYAADRDLHLWQG